jgi:hypothetical protein
MRREDKIISTEWICPIGTPNIPCYKSHIRLPASYRMGTRGSSSGVKRPGREADHSPSSSAELKEWVELYLYSPNTSSWCGA